MSDYTEKISNLIISSLEAAKLEPGQIDKILLVGGSSKIPVFRNMMTLFFPEAEIMGVNEMTSIAHGLGHTQ
ncbi:MAG: Hsp70 family protein [Desulfocapsaceae bacterium]